MARGNKRGNVGRPAVTRARVLNYIEKHQPSSIMQIVRATGAERSHIYRILRAAYGANFRSEWGHSAETASSYPDVPLAA